MFDLGFGPPAVAVRQRASIVPPLLASIDASGWSGQAAAALTLPAMTTNGSSEFGADGVAPKTVAVIRSGFDASGAATGFAESMVITKRVRQAFPNQASASAATVALSDYVFAADTIAGVTNNSAEVSPKPVAVWARPDHAVVGNSLPVEVVAFHRCGATLGNLGIACVVFTANDGTNSATLTVATPGVLGHAGDLNPVIGFAGAIDISGLSAGTVTVNAKVYPRMGTSASVLDSSVNAAGARAFAPQVYVKSGAAVRYAYVAATGVDASAVTSTTAATAAAAPFLTIKAAIEKLKTDNGTVDNCVVRVGAGSFALTTLAAGTYQGAGELIVEGDPALSTPRSSAVVTGGASAVTVTGISWVRLRNLTLQKSGGSFVSIVAGGQVVLESVNFDGNGQSTTLFSRSSGGTINVAWLGVTVTAQGASTFAHANAVTMLSRGVDCGTIGGAANFEAWAVLGSNIRGSKVYHNAKGESGTVVAFNRIGGFTSTAYVSIGATAHVTGYALVQNVIEYTAGGTSAPGLGVTRDGEAGNATHVIAWHNSFAGFWNHGRQNGFYDETPGTYRVHRLNSMVGNLHVSLNSKHDVYLGLVGNGTPNPGDAPGHVGGWSYLYGVGCYGEFARYSDAAVSGGGLGSYFAQAWPGLGAKIGTAQSGAGLDPFFASYAGTTTAGAAGAGGGNYAVGSGSPVKAMVTSGPLAGLADAGAAVRTGVQSAGAFQ